MDNKTLNISKLTDKQVNSFWNRVQRKNPKECWHWTGGKEKHGYGRFSMGKRNDWRFAHRISWVLANGDIPENLCVLHHCDNRICVNPAHLFLGSRKDNINDCIRKGRNNHARGMAIGSSKLTDSQVMEIRRRCKKYSRTNGTRALGREFNVDHGVISEIVAGKKWRHLLGEQRPFFWPENPYPKSIFPMTIDEYVEAIPDPKLRTAISGLLYREGWLVADREIWECLKDHLEDLEE